MSFWLAGIKPQPLGNGPSSGEFLAFCPRAEGGLRGSVTELASFRLIQKFEHK
jgi:hypothetical protein